MLFASCTNSTGKPEILLILTNKDIDNIKAGRTLFVDQGHQKVPPFTGVHVGYFPTTQEALATLDRMKGNPDIRLKEPEPLAGEEKCRGCNGVMRPETLYKGQCIVCWYESYHRLLGV